MEPPGFGLSGRSAVSTTSLDIRNPSSLRFCYPRASDKPRVSTEPVTGLDNARKRLASHTLYDSRSFYTHVPTSRCLCACVSLVTHTIELHWVFVNPGIQYCSRLLALCIVYIHRGALAG